MSIEEFSILQAKENYRLIEGHLKSVQIASITYSDPYAGSQLYVLQDAENIGCLAPTQFTTIHENAWCGG